MGVYETHGIIFTHTPRALALKQITNRDVPKVVLKEAGAGCLMGELNDE